MYRRIVKTHCTQKKEFSCCLLSRFSDGSRKISLRRLFCYGNLSTVDLWILKREFPKFEHRSWNTLRDVLTDQWRSWHVFTMQKDRRIKRFWHENQKGETATVRLKKNNSRPAVTIHLELATNAETKNKWRKRWSANRATKPNHTNHRRNDETKYLCGFNDFRDALHQLPTKLNFSRKIRLPPVA